MEQKQFNARFSVLGRRPDQAEAAALAALDFPRMPPSGDEVKYHVKWFFLFLLITALSLLFGFWMRRFIFGTLLFLCAPVTFVLAFVQLGKLLLSGRKKKLEKTVAWLWEKGLLGDDAVGERFGKTEYAVGVVKRCIPQGRQYAAQQLFDYVSGLRAMLGAAADETTLPRKTNGRSMASPTITRTKYAETELWPGVVEVAARYEFLDKLSYSDSRNNTQYIEGARLKLSVTETFVQCGKYWTPFDLFPAVSRTDATSAAE